MSVTCEVILRWNVTPAQLAAVGQALWGWCSRTAGDRDMYQYLDSQPLADLIAGQFPQPGLLAQKYEQRRFHFCVRDEASLDRQATIDSLRLEMPADGLEDILVEGASWNLPSMADGRGARAAALLMN